MSHYIQEEEACLMYDERSSWRRDIACHIPCSGSLAAFQVKWPVTTTVMHIMRLNFSTELARRSLKCGEQWNNAEKRSCGYGKDCLKCLKGQVLADRLGARGPKLLAELTAKLRYLRSPKFGSRSCRVTKDSTNSSFELYRPS